jgi:hypothetical protein
VPSAYAVHPEFGYLCPSSRLRRGMRVALILLVLGLIAGATSVMPTSGSSNADAGAISSARHTDEVSALAPIRATAAIKPLCEESTRAALDDKCMSSKAPKIRVVHAATNAPAIARVPLGRTTSPQASVVAPEPVVTSALDRQPTSTPSSESAQAAPVAATAAAATEPSRQSTKPQRRARSEGRQRDQDWRESGSWREARSERWSGHDHEYAGDYWRGRYGYEGSWGSSW